MLALGGASHDGTSRARPGATIDLADDRDSFSIQSDQERLAFRRLVRPEWCSAFGRGRDGRPFLEVGPSEERIRFIWQEDGERLDADTTVGGWRVEPGSLPAGVVRAGLDAHGAWIEIAPRGVGCRLRWIPPGRFLMGSPVTEAGRFHDEEQHEEEIGRGFWLGATPVTQAFFESIMAQNPSRFRSPERPVESLSWNEAAAFIERTSALVPALALRLPTEVEWEYACRAGTTTATYAGDLEILGERNAPRLDAIAWYGGNSGVGWDLEEGHDSSAWPEKQFPHQRAGTRPVGLKKANAWGLQDMLGNVWEWCADLEMGTKAGRVFRGGSWYGRFRNLRAATRHALVVDGRDSSLGLRIARGSSDFRSRPAGESVSGGQLGEPRPKEARRARKKKQ
ncbi:MAG: formylglycine-generating enzyme family protein [Planctomycetes bacterium]|nr:formylglycine-generating enzyme family protein [Planctomycetota bacterium]